MISHLKMSRSSLRQRYVSVLRSHSRWLDFLNEGRRKSSFEIGRAPWQPKQQRRAYHFQNESVRKSFSSSTQPSSSASTTDSPDLVRPQGSIAVTPPLAVFPWRHESEPLPRLIKGTRDNVEQGGVFGPGVPFEFPWYAPWILEAISANRLLVPWYRILAGNQWRHDLAESCSWAFSQGVAAIISNTYRVPFEEIKSDDKDEISFRLDVENDVDLSNDEQSKEKDSAEDAVQFCPEVEYMLEAKLRHLYESAHECGKGNMRIRLECQPTSATLESLAWIPFLTRDMVASKPALKHAYNMRQEMAKRAETLGRAPSGTDAMRFGMEIADQLAKETAVYQTEPREQHVWYGTVVAQVSVECQEIFSVVDLKTGEIIQGHADEKARTVTHLVRLENEVQTAFPVDGSSPIHDMGSWQITDWDDLLDGNLWLSL